MPGDSDDGHEDELARLPLLSQELLQNVSDGEETGEVESPAPPPPPDHPPPSSAEEHSSVEEHSSADEFLEEEEEPIGLGAETGAGGVAVGRGAPAPRLGLGRAGVINRWKMGADFVLGAEEVNIPEIQFRSVVEALQERSLKMRKKSMDIGEGLPLPPASPAQNLESQDPLPTSLPLAGRTD